MERQLAAAEQAVKWRWLAAEWRRLAAEWCWLHTPRAAARAAIWALSAIAPRALRTLQLLARRMATCLVLAAKLGDLTLQTLSGVLVRGSSCIYPSLEILAGRQAGQPESGSLAPPRRLCLC